MLRIFVKDGVGGPLLACMMGMHDTGEDALYVMDVGF